MLLKLYQSTREKENLQIIFTRSEALIPEAKSETIQTANISRFVTMVWNSE